MGQPQWYQILEAVVDAMKPYARHGVNVNVDFYAGVVYFLNGIAEDLFVPIFAVGRVPGWTVQVVEQIENNILHPAAHALQRPGAARLRADRATLAALASHRCRQVSRRSSGLDSGLRQMTNFKRLSQALASTIAAVATMSSTVAPRDKSDSGRANPCNTGPTARAPAMYCVSL